MTKKILIMVSVVMLMALVGCHQETVEVTNTTKPSTTVTTTTTKIATTQAATTTTTQPQFAAKLDKNHGTKCRAR